MSESVQAKIEKSGKKPEKIMTDQEFRDLVDSVEELIGKKVPDKKNISTQDFLDFVRDSALYDEPSIWDRIEGGGRSSYAELEARSEKEWKKRHEEQVKEEARIEKERQEILKNTSLEQIIDRVKSESLDVDIKEGESLSKERIPTGTEYLKFLEENGTPEHVLAYQKVLEISKIIKEAGGRAFLVGGSVRDMFMGKIPKDFDLEVYKLPDQSLSDLLTVTTRELGGSIKTDVGKSFGITKVAFKVAKQFEGDDEKQIDLDISIPRTESKSGAGHKDFGVVLHPEMSIEEAARRRDFTMNSLAADAETGEVFDPRGGITNIRRRELRVTDEERFKDDPLRVLRAMQFIGRYTLSVNQETARIITETLPGLKHISKERFGEEWDKLLMKSEQPSYGLIAGMVLGVFNEAYPEFVKLAETLQEFEWHPEGDVWIHTLMVVDAAARIARRENLNEEDARVVMYTMLCHDLGKGPTTKFDPEKGRIRSVGHDKAGIDLTENFLNRIGASNDVKAKVKALVGDHLAPGLMHIEFVLKNQDGKKDPKGALRKLAKRIYPATMKLLAIVGEADHMGRGPFVYKVETGEPASEKDVIDFTQGQLSIETAKDINNVFKFAMPEDYPAAKWFLGLARELKVEESKPENIISGKMLERVGYIGGKGATRNIGIILGEIIQIANDLRDEMQDRYSSSDKIFAELVDWYEEPYPHPAMISDPAKARDRLKKILDGHRSGVIA
ncbi:MAG: CCA tRNA nucleotidyltransferase [Candidatus Vogelbacteria bacterium]|nr:CCA tRNA nucleotidyltransferase [Candidatus Vogelbacteria bacterium]